MFGERCTLCGGKLDSRKICKECGLNNSKSEKNYKINKSSCDVKPLTHVHDEKHTEPKPKRQYQKELTAPKQNKKIEPLPGAYQLKEKKPKQKKAKWAAKLVAVFVIFSAVGTIIGSLSVMDIHIPFSSENDEDLLNPYEMLEQSGEELPAEGENADYDLESGEYIVGVHIPAGNYFAAMDDDFDVVQVQDREHGIYLYEYPAKEGADYRDDLRLFDGALVRISAQGTVLLSTENAQTVQNEDNPLTKSYSFEGNDEKTAGVDFEPGVYDIYAEEGYGEIDIWISNEEYDEDEFEDDYESGDYEAEHIYVGYGSANGPNYNNVIIPEGAKLVMGDESSEVEEKFKITLTPSPVIASTDYLQTYRDYH